MEERQLIDDRLTWTAQLIDTNGSTTDFNAWGELPGFFLRVQADLVRSSRWIPGQVPMSLSWRVTAYEFLRGYAERSTVAYSYVKQSQPAAPPRCGECGDLVELLYSSDG